MYCFYSLCRFWKFFDELILPDGLLDLTGVFELDEALENLLSRVVLGLLLRPEVMSRKKSKISVLKIPILGCLKNQS